MRMIARNATESDMMTVHAPKRCELCGSDLEPSPCVDGQAHKLYCDIWAMLDDPSHDALYNARKLYVMLARAFGRRTTRQIGQAIGCSPMAVSKIARTVAAEYPAAAGVLMGRFGARRHGRNAHADPSEASAYKLRRVVRHSWEQEQ